MERLFKLYSTCILISCVSVNNNTSSLFKSYRGVGLRQGENLSLILFSICINDLETQLERTNIGMSFHQPHIKGGIFNLFILLYAIDTYCYYKPNPHLFSKSLEWFWCLLCKMEINMNKTNVFGFKLNNEEM